MSIFAGAARGLPACAVQAPRGSDAALPPVPAAPVASTSSRFPLYLQPENGGKIEFFPENFLEKKHVTAENNC